MWQDIEKIANEIGIDLIGVADLKGFDSYIATYREREANGWLSGFEPKDLSLIENPKDIMEGTKSIIAVGISYNMPKQDFRADNIWAYLSKSSLGLDYHIVVRDKLQKLMEYLKTQYENLEYKIFVDNGPLPDREVAHRAGIGFFGKNNSIINPVYGSFLFLGYVVLNVFFEPNKEVINSLCGTCKKCINACPTASIIEENSFNAQNCISFNTQKKYDIDEVIKKKISYTIYGCDICQDICPFNKNAKKVFHSEFYVDEKNNRISINDFLLLSNKEFKQMFSNYACAWRGKKTLQRNIKIVLENKPKN